MSSGTGVLDYPTEFTPSPIPRQRPLGRRQWLVQRQGVFWERGRVLEFEPAATEGTLGRSPACTWRITDASISRLHAALVRKPRRGVYVVDLASRHGTFVNGERVQGELLLMDGDRIRLGDKIEVEFLDSPPPVEGHERRWLRRAWWGVGALGLVVVLTVLLH
jgi:pSer/pThr/pTyr-binding forkhead associated (FHA) protein